MLLFTRGMTIGRMRIVIVLLECKVEGDRGTNTEGMCQRWN